MQFTSFSFLAFFGIFFVFYVVFSRRLWMQNLWLLLAGYVFYSLINWRFLLLLVLITLTDFCLGWWMGQSDPHAAQRTRLRKLMLCASLVIDIGLLVIFKYYGFFVPDFVRILDHVGISADPATLNFILPVGISFYTLKSMSYTLDVYHGRQAATGNLLDYAIYVGFFPALFAGPIDRAKTLLPQIQRPRKITSSNFNSGLSLILWGYFQKLVVADNLALISNSVFQSGSSAHGADIILGVLAFTIQIYADFSGYTDIARGIARLMGFELMVNFKLPYFALNPADFWQRWHISLSEWLRDYIFFPVRRAVLGWRIRNAALWGVLLPPLITMAASGLWHGTGWNFIFWGIYHGMLLIGYRLLSEISIPKPINTWINSWIGVIIRMGVMFFLVSLGWLFFRADTLTQAFDMVRSISLVTSPDSVKFINDVVFFSLPLVVVQLWQAYKGNLLVLSDQRFPVQVAISTAILLWIIIFGTRQVTEFIYSQF